ncbi:hypothetical protein B9Z55_009039 [Caenorhabditis nigoni]|uniref:F-box domain-containing protein n=2 Tax=Caenorhabditis nigoni TaxID=1611254 RepID=A0A2G5UQD2_9PELO|nr:hypothetical protein B9Z55_009039 [Caenorhabditis nigoni]
MKLSKYPNLVQKEILDNMKYSDLFLLSFVSKNMKNIIKSSQAARFKSISRIVYNMQNTNYRTIYIPLGSSEEVIMKSWDISEMSNNDYFQLKVSGEIINFRSSRHHFPIANFHQSDRESVFESIHNYFLDFFGYTVKYQWIANNYMLYFPQLPSLSLILKFWKAGGDKRYIKKLEHSISSSPIMEHIELTFWESTATLNAESKFYQAESIRIFQDNPTVPVNLGCFQGKRAFFTCNQGRISDLSEFVNRWKSGEAFQNLEHLEIVINHPDYPLNGVLDAIGVKYIDATKIPPTHTLPKVYFECGHKRNTDPIISHTYVVRETDNRVASISIERKTFSFGVWNKTEEEFLAMVK